MSVIIPVLQLNIALNVPVSIEIVRNSIAVIVDKDLVGYKFISISSSFIFSENDYISYNLMSKTISIEKVKKITIFDEYGDKIIYVNDSNEIGALDLVNQITSTKCHHQQSDLYYIFIINGVEHQICTYNVSNDDILVIPDNANLLFYKDLLYSIHKREKLRNTEFFNDLKLKTTITFDEYVEIIKKIVIIKIKNIDRPSEFNIVEKVVYNAETTFSEFNIVEKVVYNAETDADKLMVLRLFLLKQNEDKLFNELESLAPLPLNFLDNYEIPSDYNGNDSIMLQNVIGPMISKCKIPERLYKQAISILNKHPEEDCGRGADQLCNYLNLCQKIIVEYHGITKLEDSPEEVINYLKRQYTWANSARMPNMGSCIRW